MNQYYHCESKRHTHIAQWDTSDTYSNNWQHNTQCCLWYPSTIVTFNTKTRLCWQSDSTCQMVHYKQLTFGGLEQRQSVAEAHSWPKRIQQRRLWRSHSQHISFEQWVWASFALLIICCGDVWSEGSEHGKRSVQLKYVLVFWWKLFLSNHTNIVCYLRPWKDYIMSPKSKSASSDKKNACGRTGGYEKLM